MKAKSTIPVRDAQTGSQENLAQWRSTNRAEFGHGMKWKSADVD